MSGFHRLTTGKLGSRWEHVSPIFGRHQGGVSEDFTYLCFLVQEVISYISSSRSSPKTLSFFS